MNWLLRQLAIILILLVLLFSGYVLWDVHQVYKTAGDVQSQILQLKPTDLQDEGGLKKDFDELKKINQDVCGWMTINGTRMDYPIVKGKNNQKYLNTDIFGSFSLAGSIFLDSRNSADFSDPYSIIYGHHMDNHQMFGDLDLFKDPDYFNSHTHLELVTPDKTFEYEALAILELPDNISEIFDPTTWESDLEGLGEFIEDNAIYYSEENVQQLVASSSEWQVLALVTCQPGVTGMKTVMLYITEREEPPQPPDEPDTPDDPDNPNHPDKPDKPDDPKHPDKPDKPDDPKHPDKPNQPVDPKHPDDPNNPDAPNNPNHPVQTGDASQVGWLLGMAAAIGIGILTGRKRHKS